jgi:hypothetical protein
MRRAQAVAVIALGACGSGKAPDVSGDWSVCLESQARIVCGSAEVAASRGPVGRYLAWFPLTFQLELDSVPGLVRPRSDRCGSVLVDQEKERGISVVLGIRCLNVTEADGGNLDAEFLDLRGDSLMGEWYQSCFAGCSARGRLTMVRQRG